MGQQPDPRVLANPLVKQTLKVDPSTWQASAALSPEVRAKVEATLARQRALKAARAGQEVKVGSLLRAYQRAAATAEPTPAGRVRAMRSRLPILGVEPDGSVRARIHLRGGPDAEAAIRALGVRIARVSADRRVLYAALSAADIDRVAAQAVVAKISPIVGAKVNAGSVLSEGVAALRADRVQAQLRVTGKKVRIGVISDGIESIAAPAATGDIPATSAGLPKVELCPLNDNSGDEGTAMLEIVHDMAPGAALAFCPAFGDTGQQGLADAVTWLATQAFGGKGADVIVDDVGYLTEPFFQDGVIAQAVDAAVAHGVSYFSSAGNSADAHYEHVYRDIVPGDDFQSSRSTRTISAASPACRRTSAGTASSPATATSSPPSCSGTIRSAGRRTTTTSTSSTPTAISPAIRPATSRSARPASRSRTATTIRWRSPSSSTISLDRRPSARSRGSSWSSTASSPTRSKLLELQFNGFFAVDPAKNIAEGSIFGHAASRGAMAVAATGAVENIDGTPNPGLDVIEEFSSRGPSRIFFTPAGAPAPEVRRKPNTTAVDGTSVTGVNFFTPFFGTSASAPHAAAVAVLLKDVDPGLRPAGIARILRETSLERGTPGFDTTWGFGLIDAFAAAKRAGQVGNSHLFWVCLPTKKGIQLVVPEFLIPGALALGLDFGRCD